MSTDVISLKRLKAATMNDYTSRLNVFQIAQYERKIQDLITNNNTLTNALSTSTTTINQQSIIIANLEKKLSSQQLLDQKFRAIDKAVLHLNQLWKEAQVLFDEQSTSTSENVPSEALSSFRANCRVQSPYVNLLRPASSIPGAWDSRHNQLSSYTTPRTAQPAQNVVEVSTSEEEEYIEEEDDEEEDTSPIEAVPISSRQVSSVSPKLGRTRVDTLVMPRPKNHGKKRKSDDEQLKSNSKKTASVPAKKQKSPKSTSPKTVIKITKPVAKSSSTVKTVTPPTTKTVTPAKNVTPKTAGRKKKNKKNTPKATPKRQSLRKTRSNSVDEDVDKIVGEDTRRAESKESDVASEEHDKSSEEDNEPEDPQSNRESSVTTKYLNDLRKIALSWADTNENVSSNDSFTLSSVCSVNKIMYGTEQPRVILHDFRRTASTSGYSASSAAENEAPSVMVVVAQPPPVGTQNCEEDCRSVTNSEDTEESYYDTSADIVPVVMTNGISVTNGDLQQDDEMANHSVVDENGIEDAEVEVGSSDVASCPTVSEPEGWNQSSYPSFKKIAEEFAREMEEII